MRTKCLIVIMGLLCLLPSQWAKADLYNDGGVHEIDVYGTIDQIDVDNPPPTSPAFTTVNIGLMGMAPSLNSLNTFNSSRVTMLYGEIADLDAYDSSQVTLNDVDVFHGATYGHSRVTANGPESLRWAAYDSSELTLNEAASEWDLMEVIAYDNSQVTINGNASWVEARDNSRVTLNGYAGTFWANRNTRVNGGAYSFWASGPLTIDGGWFWEFNGAPYVRVTGGHFGSIQNGGMTMVGSDFAVYSWDDLINPVFSGYGDWTRGPAYDYFLWGTLANGDRLEGVWLNLSPGDHVSFVPVPGAALLGVLGVSVAGWRLRRKLV